MQRKIGKMRVWYEGELGPRLAPLWERVPHERVASPEDAHVLLVPEVIWGTLTRELAGRVRAYDSLAAWLGIRAVVFLVLDDETPLDWVTATLVFRTSLVRSRRLPHEHVLAYPWECRERPLPPSEPRRLGSRGMPPAVGFCGAPGTHPTRAETLAALASDPRVEARFVMRDRFWGGRPGASDLVDDFYANMAAVEFVACPRGIGNFSMRLYQTLAAGRVPVLVDTGAPLPDLSEAGVGWEDVAAMAASPSAAPDAVVAFCEAHPDLPAVQRACRAAYDASLSFAGFARTVERIVEEALPSPSASTVTPFAAGGIV